MGTTEKIKPLAVLADILSRARADQVKIVHCHGVFDLLHIGHIRYFKQAKRMGDLLVVTVTPDRYVDKGPHRPAFLEVLRAEAIASLDCVDYVAINEWPTAEETLRLLKPHVYVKGSEFKDVESDMTGKIAREAEVVREIGAELAFTEDIVFSSSTLINRFLSNFPQEMDEYLAVLRKRTHLASILKVLDDMASLDVLVIGDAILDEYQYCEAMGKSSKDPILALRYQNEDRFAGGAAAVANHVAGFARQVTLLSVLGERESHEAFFRESLDSNVSPHFFFQPGAPTIVKRRFLDGYSLHKLFEVYVMDGTGLPREEDRRLQQWLTAHLSEYDLVIAADFGHGTISQDTVKTLCESSRFLAVNTQANAGNRHFHTISRYPRADFVCIAEHEIRLETRDLSGEIRTMIETIARKMEADHFVVTRGSKGCVIRGEDGEYIEVPSLTGKIVDRVGAGDAFYALTAMAAAQGVSSEVLALIGNVAGGLAVEIVGNQKPIDKQSVKKFITSLMK
ncbi:MAG: PfkB family carbohydrate kinase [Thermodesulfobacteriota bacterium]